MAKDAVATMGCLLPHDVRGRDAVHVAVFSAVARTSVFPGQPVAIKEHRDDGDTVVVPVASDGKDRVGIVDPFLNELVVVPGSRFWVYLQPRTITALAHQWSHPAFDGKGVEKYIPPANKLASENWLRGFLKTTDCPSYETLMPMLEKAVESGYNFYDADIDHGISLDKDYVYLSGMDGHAEIPVEFWDHVEVVLGKSVPHRPKYFTCSC